MNPKFISAKQVMRSKSLADLQESKPSAEKVPCPRKVRNDPCIGQDVYHSNRQEWGTIVEFVEHTNRCMDSPPGWIVAFESGQWRYSDWNFWNNFSYDKSIAGKDSG